MDSNFDTKHFEGWIAGGLALHQAFCVKSVLLATLTGLAAQMREAVVLCAKEFSIGLPKNGIYPKPNPSTSTGKLQTHPNHVFSAIPL